MSDLGGRRVVVTRPAAHAASMCRLLEERNARPIVFPTVEIVAFRDNPLLRRVLQEWVSFDWVVFTSVNGVEIFFDEARRAGVSVSQAAGAPAFAAIGPATARALVERGKAVHSVPREYVAEGLVAALGDVAGQRILLPRAQKARKLLADRLRGRGATVVEVATYDTVVPSSPSNPDEILSGGVDAFTFTSSSTVEGLVRLLGNRAAPVLAGTCVACIGPITAETARRRGIHVDVVADEYTTVGLVEALQRHFSSQ